MSFSITILTFCRKGGALDAEIERYQKLLSPWVNVAVSYLKSPGGSSYGRNELLEAEAKILAASIPKKSFCVALSEEGKCPAGSRNFAQWLSAHELRSHAMTFIIGGAYGLSPRLKKECAELLSLSPLTFSHKLSLVVLLEQIYRAFTILKGHPYHK
jgi:23S rRNA (pseudouridine1915-N3)-methyltransferase